MIKTRRTKPIYYRTTGAVNVKDQEETIIGGLEQIGVKQLYQMFQRC
jgi:hypothetical protein